MRRVAPAERVSSPEIIEIGVTRLLEKFNGPFRLLDVPHVQIGPCVIGGQASMTQGPEKFGREIGPAVQRRKSCGTGALAGGFRFTNSFRSLLWAEG